MECISNSDQLIQLVCYDMSLNLLDSKDHFLINVLPDPIITHLYKVIIAKALTFLNRQSTLSKEN